MSHNIKYQTKNTITVGVGYFKCPIPKPDAPTQSRPAKDDDWDEQYDDYECDEDEDQYSAYDFQMPTRGGGGGGKQKQGPYTTRHVRIQEENLARARQRSVVKNAERFQKKFSGSA